MQTNGKAIIFDLDGTLTQSEEGIWNCVRYAADKMGIPEPDTATLRKFIGPPLRYSFEHELGLMPADAEQAVAFYRERYNTVGQFENRVYPGIRRLLRLLKQDGWYIAIATGKPQEPTDRIIDYFRLTKYFDRIIGTSETQGPDKAKLITAVLPETFSEAWMVGDRLFDVQGGLANGIRTVGVGYGYGSEEELRSAGCEVYVPTVDALIRHFCGDATTDGVFLSMEGPDGSGKSTQLRLLQDTLDRFGFEVVMTREPGGTPIGEKIRDILLDPANTEMDPETEAILYAAGRAQHVRELIRPTIASGKLVLSDRFVDSSIAYQGGGRGLGVDHITKINAPAVDDVLPLMTIYLDIDSATAMARRFGASDPDRMELAGDSFHARVEEAYHQLITRDPQRFLVTDATKTPEEIAADIRRRLLDRLEEKDLL